MIWNYEARISMGLMGTSDRGHHNGNVRDTSNPDGAKHAADKTVQPNLDAVRGLRGSDHQGKHRA